MTSAEDGSVYVKTSKPSLSFLFMVSLTEGTSILTESTHSFGQVLLPGQMDSTHASAAEWGQTPLPAANTHQKFAWFPALGAGKGDWSWYIRLGCFSASSWRVIWKSIQEQWGCSARMRAGATGWGDHQGASGLGRAGCSPDATAVLGIHGQQTLTEALHDTSPGAAPTSSLWAPQADKGLISNSRDQGVSAVRGPQECGPCCGHERVGGSYIHSILMGCLCNFSWGAPFVLPSSSRVAASL